MQKIQNTNTTKYKHDKIQIAKIQIRQQKMEQNTNVLMPKYKHNKIQKNKIQIAKIQL